MTGTGGKGMIGALLLGACTMGPDYEVPRPRLSGPLPYLPAGLTVPDAAVGEWWRLYRDPALDRLIAQAFRANSDLAAARAHLDSAAALLAVTRGARLPVTTVSGGASYGRSATSDQIAAANDRAPEDALLEQAGLEVAWEIDLPGRIRRAIEAGRADTEVAAATRDATRMAVVARTVQAYVRACAIGSQIDVATEAVSVAVQERDVVARRLEAGGADRFDLAMQESLLARSRAALPSIEAERRASLFALAEVVGATPQDVPVVAASCRRVPALAGPIPVGDGSALLARRPDVRAAERRMAAASARIGVAKADLVPRVNLLGGLGSTAPSTDTLGIHATTSFHLGPLITWSFPNLSVARARVRQAQANDRAAIAEYEGTVLRALSDVEQALAVYAGVVDREAALAAAERHALSAWSLARDRESAGSISRLELLTAQQTLIQARLASAEVRTARVDATVTVFKALGGGWEPGPAQGRPTR